MIALKVYLSFYNVLWGIALYSLFPKSKNNYLSFLVVVFTVYHPWMQSFKSEVVSDISFAATFALSLFFIHKIKNDTPLIQCVLIGLLLGLCCLIRPLGFILFATMVFLFFMKKEYRVYFAKYLTVVVIAFFLIFVIRSIVFPCEGAYAHYYSFFGRDLVYNFSQNSLFYFSEWKKFWTDLCANELLKNVCMYGSCLLLLFGAFRYLLSQNVYALTVLLYLIVVLIWPYRNQGFRFVFPVLPFLVYAVFESLEKILHTIRPAMQWIAYALIACLIVLDFFADQTTYKNYITSTGSQTNSAKELYAFLTTHIPQKSRLVFTKPRVLCLYGHVNALYPMAGMDYKQMTEEYTRYQVQYFVCARNKGLECYNAAYTNYLDSMEMQKVLLWSNADFEVYKRNP